MMKRLWKFSPVLFVALAAAVALAQDAKFLERFTATGVRMQTGRSSTVLITIARWSTPEERQMLLDTLREKGGDALAETLFKMPRVGFIRLPDSSGKDLHYAWQTPMPDGSRRVVVGMERQLTFRQGTSRAQDYEFGVVEMRFDKNGKGEGKLSAMAKVEIDKKTDQVEIKNYDSEPVRLVKIKAEKGA